MQISEMFKYEIRPDLITKTEEQCPVILGHCHEGGQSEVLSGSGIVYTADRFLSDPLKLYCAHI